MKNKTINDERKKKDGRGGKRAGAGRKKQNKKTVTLSFRIDEHDMWQLKQLYHNKGDIAQMGRNAVKQWIENKQVLNKTKINNYENK